MILIWKYSPWFIWGPTKPFKDTKSQKKRDGPAQDIAGACIFGKKIASEGFSQTWSQLSLPVHQKLQSHLMVLLLLELLRCFVWCCVNKHITWWYSWCALLIIGVHLDKIMGVEFPEVMFTFLDGGSSSSLSLIPHWLYQCHTTVALPALHLQPHFHFDCYRCPLLKLLRPFPFSLP